MTEEPELPSPLWTLKLHGTACAWCGLPARYMAVFDTGRGVAHASFQARACWGVNVLPPVTGVPVKRIEGGYLDEDLVMAG